MYTGNSAGAMISLLWRKKPLFKMLLTEPPPISTVKIQHYVTEKLAQQQVVYVEIFDG